MLLSNVLSFSVAFSFLEVDLRIEKRAPLVNEEPARERAFISTEWSYCIKVGDGIKERCRISTWHSLGASS